jgi:GDP-4-dehydro-6-deoxy-D-mannose reductase
MKALITGIAGFAGSHLADHLLDQGFDVTGISYPGFPLDNLQHCLDRIEVIQLSITNHQDLKEVVYQIKPDCLFHLAAISSVSKSWEGREAIFKTNIEGSFNVLEACREMQSAPKILLVSSGEVYGPIENTESAAQENQSYNPISPYAATKAAMEILGTQYIYSDSLPIYIARPFNHSGPRQSNQFVCSAFAYQIAAIELKKKEPMLYVGNLKAQRDFSDVRDIVDGYLKIVQRGEAGEVYNLCSNRAISIEEILRILLSYSAEKIEVAQKESLFRPCDTPLLLGDNTKAKKDLRWVNEKTLEETLADLLNFWRKKLKSQK